MAANRDCVILGEYSKSGNNSLVVGFCVESLRCWRGASATDSLRRAHSVVDVLFLKAGDEESYLLVGHPHKVRVEHIRDVRRPSEEFEIAFPDYNRAVLDVYHDERANIRFEDSDEGLALKLEANFPRKEASEELTVIYAVDNRIESETDVLKFVGDSTDEVSEYTITKIGPFRKRGNYAVRLMTTIEGPTLQNYERAPMIYQVAGPGVLYSDIDACQRSSSVDASVPEWCRVLLTGHARRIPMRYDVVLFPDEIGFPHFTRFNSGIRQRPVRDEKALAFASTDKRQTFLLELNFDPRIACSHPYTYSKVAATASR